LSIPIKLRITREQYAKFLSDHDTIKQFEQLIAYVNTLDTFQFLFVGDVEGGDYLEIEPDGTWLNHGEGTTWDDISQPLIGRNISSASTRITYNYTELTLDYLATARYPTELVGVVVQMPHGKKTGSDIFPHIHWIQTSADTPNILIEYRIYNNGEAVPATWTLKALTGADNSFAYPGSGSFQQIIAFNLPTGSTSSLGLSGTFDCKIYRDAINASGLFAGADAYAGSWAVKYYDIHIEKDMNGSRDMFVK
jgi:hypothetical protein